MNKGSVLRNLLARDEILILPGAFDALSARLIEEVGFPAVYATGAGFANAALGLPDIGFVGLAELALHVGRMTDVVDIPVLVDADTGYGGVLQVRRTVRELERAGAAGIQLEDQVAPKRCGHFDGQQVIPIDEMVSKISIARDSRRDDATVIVARTDARSPEGFDATVTRATAYAEAGADLVFVEALSTREELLTMPSLVRVPLVANIVEGGKTPLTSATDLQDAGYKVALFANTALRASMAAIRETMTIVREDGSSERVLDRIATWQERQGAVRLHMFSSIESRYIDSDPAHTNQNIASRSTFSGREPT